MKVILTLAVTILVTVNSYSQTDYFQQEVKFTMKVRLDDERHELHAHQSIVYVNNSPDELSFIYYHLWPNAYKNRQTAYAKQKIVNGSQLFHYTKEKNLGYIDSLNFTVDGKTVQIESDPENPDIIKLLLPEKLKPGGSVTIETPFKVKLPASFSRLGHVRQQYQITQWYPKPAVYDKDGWHPMPYLDQGEFYSEFGSFDVSITVPRNYVVGATGNLQDQEEIEYLEQKAEETKKWDPKDFEKDTFPESSSEYKTLRYVQDNVHDFAWFADKRYLVKLGKVTLPGSDKQVKLIAMYNKANAEVWEDIIEYMHDGIYYYSKWVGEYPYDVITVVDGALSAGSGMEYPTITVLGAQNKILLELVTVHEIGHNWFYGILASNERENPWLDEGLNSYVEQRYFRNKYKEMGLLGTDPNKKEEFKDKMANYFNVSTTPADQLYPIAYKAVTCIGKDQPLQTHSNEFTAVNYGIISYQKTATLLTYLEAYLGEEMFDLCMQTYYNSWEFKHVQPTDFEEVFKRVSGKELAWFFEDFVKTTKTLEYKVNKITGTQKDKVTISNIGEISGPVEMGLLKDGDVVHSFWVEGFQGSKEININWTGDYDEITIDPYLRMPDLNNHNNEIRTKGLFKKTQPLKLKFIGAIDYPKKTSIYWLPALGGNTNDNFMLGGLFYNSLIPEKRFRYILMPMYSFGLERHAGFYDLAYIWRSKSFRRIELGENIKDFAGFQRYQTRLTFEINPESPRFDATQQINLKHNLVQVERTLLPNYQESYQVGQIGYIRNKKNALHNTTIQAEITSNFDSFTLAEASYTLVKSYKRNHNFTLRVYGATFLQVDDVHPIFHLNFSGSPDYTMDHTFLDRARTSRYVELLTNQTDLAQGGMRGFIEETTDTGLAALNFDIDVPNFKVLEIFVDSGVELDRGDFYYTAGASLNFFDLLILHFPLLGDIYADATPHDWEDFTDNIRFTLNLNKVNPYRIIRDNL